MLHTEPSFSIYSSDDKFGEEAENEELIKQKLAEIKRTATIGESIESQFSFGPNAMRIIEEADGDEDDDDDEGEEKGRASNGFKDFKIEPAVGGDGVEFAPFDSDHDKYYTKMVCQDPSNPLVLRNYAQYLERKKDFSGAEEYYFRATMADLKDGEILSQYAKFVWEFHRDQARAITYFERAIQAAPEDSDVLAAYASFLWKTEETTEENLSNTQVVENSVLVDQSVTDFNEENRPSSPSLHLAMGLGMNVDGFGGSNNAADYISTNSDQSTSCEELYRRMVEENPHSSMLLRNYAQFLHQSKGDLHGAEEYYSRAIDEDPHNEEILSIYANIVWQLHHNKDRAVAYFERAVAATPEDSNVLAAYAKFLWETETEEEEEEVIMRK